MNASNALYAAAGLAAGVAGMGAVAAWGSSAQAYRVSCRPEGVKAAVACSVATEGKFWNLDSGVYINAEANFPNWKTALGGKCSDRYREYWDYVDATWEKVEGSEFEARLVRSDPRFYFDCYNRVES
ncbi:hypothetical protein EN745_07605 [Mesorhizobium sp. M4A.F.Ca.ET.022.05.2.1]|uniref:hypothetical protein n=1 Tax=unclassified Mesorhizobium TaxID=325217 RepID=UPI000FCC42B5|nr:MULTISPECIES: hypothetical protein [unclassified Mesorhizobium]RVC82137.1 hypothetical protein EN745_07605 [Mesorhizobium sp. M4A.F.Ca.ET.022.05.2.1]RVD72599.1 hypothetical protein EN751_09265 [Mesorhizobium sp. M4A.F.Ca.ET.029.04.2.1]TIW35887.1 MAG: hypothetical protein E5V62_09235 [Mesorhizobium sp.]